MKKGDLILFHDHSESCPPEPGVVLDVDAAVGNLAKSCDVGLIFVNFEGGNFWVDIDDCEILNEEW